jgi:hypothetical protein
MQLGLPNLGETEGPFFAYDYFIFDTFVEVAVYALFSDGSFRTSWVVASTDFAGVWAVAEKVAVPLPAPVALLLAGLAGIGYSRKRFSQVERV